MDYFFHARDAVYRKASESIISYFLTKVNLDRQSEAELEKFRPILETKFGIPLGQMPELQGRRAGDSDQPDRQSPQESLRVQDWGYELPPALPQVSEGVSSHHSRLRG